MGHAEKGEGSVMKQRSHSERQRVRRRLLDSG